MLMKPLAGGLLCSGKAFPGHAWRPGLPAPLPAGDVLRYLLMDDAIACVVPGIASIEEAAENAAAGTGDTRLDAESMARVRTRVDNLSRVLCSRCGKCDDLCSKGLPISFIFRAAYHYLYPTAPFGISSTLQYFRLVPSDDAPCSPCTERSCQCPSDIDIPKELTSIHQKMVELRGQGLVPFKDTKAEDWNTGRSYSCKVLSQEIPSRIIPGECVTIRLQLRNTGTRPWHKAAGNGHSSVALGVYLNGHAVQTVRLRKDVHPTDDCHFAYTVQLPAAPGPYLLRMGLFDLEAGPFYDGNDHAIRAVLRTPAGANPLEQHIRIGGSTPGQERREILLWQDELRSSEVLQARCIESLRRTNEELRSQLHSWERENQEGSPERKAMASIPAYTASRKTALRSVIRKKLEALGLYGFLRAHHRIFSPVYNFFFRDTWAPSLNASEVRKVKNPASAAGSLSAQYIDHNAAQEYIAGSRCVLRVLVKNTGSATWERDRADGHCVGLSLFVNSEFAGFGKAVPALVAPGESAVIAVTAMMPAVAGTHQLKFDMAVVNKTWFSALGVPPLELSVQVREDVKNRTEELLDLAYNRNSWFFSPSQGIHRSNAKPRYPIFAESTQGYTVTDVDGREYVDFHMGWGCCLLGYGNERIQQAVSRCVSKSAGIISLPHRLELEVSDLLCSRFPFGDEALFGKNGSDVTTWAVRTARIATGKKTVLFAGYHGWQDWYVGCQGFEASGVPDGNNRYNISLPYLDTAALENAVAAYKGDIAAIMIEPAATDIDVDDPHHLSDASYLKKAEGLARACGALFILDEIMTGFRFLKGSAQAAYGLTPDLTCLGKAIANGMPLSALTARNGLLRQCIAQIYYAPTMKGDVYSYAAAKEALQIYASEDIATKVWETGDRIRKEVNQLCTERGLNAALIGSPYRMYFHFPGLSGERNVFSRTLLQQELTRNGVISYKGFIILSHAHDETAVDKCVEGFRAALDSVSNAMSTGAFVEYLDIPDVILETRTHSPVRQNDSPEQS
jgi:glutamate-1-semialdehyde aminotransferase